MPFSSLSLLYLLAALGALSGCATPVSSEHADASPSEAVACPAQESIPVTRHGRYTLVELAPDAAQRDLLRQVVEIAIPPTLDASVGDALQHLLRHSGYRLCASAEIEALTTLPLPAAHRRLGPLALSDALRVLAGPAWELAVDTLAREVCFGRRTAIPAGDPAPLSESREARP
ncbi:MAG: PilL N-terminal domain-containing protein [Candidatus Accumulibacter sp.]|jgi:type IV pili sensor histidine kinase/response regulator|nr:PilL N-terminal domain-containing protein [Accumulibacter sp.]